MDKKVFSIILGVALIASFFLPYMSYGDRSANGLDIVKNAGEASEPIMAYIWLVFPISGLMLLLGALNKGNYPGGRALWLWLPLLALIYILIIYPITNGMDIGDVFKGFGKGFGIGLWIALAASVIGVAYNPRN
jgi:hypothetical protein